MADPLSAAFAAAEALAGLGVSVYLMGGLAANVYRAEQRLTEDADLLVTSSLRSAASITRSLAAAGFGRPPGRFVYRVGGFEWRRLLYPAGSEDPAIVDLFFASVPFLYRAVARAGKARDKKGSIGIISVEDLVVLKSIAAVDPGRGRKKITDQDDVSTILAAAKDGLHEIDLGYLREQAESLGALRLVDRQLRRAGLG